MFVCLDFLPAEKPLLPKSEEEHGHESEGECQFESDISSIIGISDQFTDRTFQPYLRHTHDGSEDAETEGYDGGDSRR